MNRRPLAANRRPLLIAASLVAPLLSSAGLARAAGPSVTGPSVTGFESGMNGWGVYFFGEDGLGDTLLPDGGNPGANLGVRFPDTFGLNLRNDSNPAVLGDYTQLTFGVRFGIDVKVNLLQFFGSDVSRDLVLELVDTNPEGSEYPYTSVFYDLGDISSALTGGWTTLGVTITDPTAAALPAGWGGYGAEDPVTFEPILPAGRTFASVLASVDEIRFTTFKPGFFYGFTAFDVQYDNVTVEALLPEPTTLALAAAALPLVARRRRRSIAPR